MIKPSAFQNTFVARSNIPYLFCDDSGKPQPESGGVLSRGQLLWLRDVMKPFGRLRSTAAFVEGVGLVAIDSRWLVDEQPQALDNHRRRKQSGVLAQQH